MAAKNWTYQLASIKIPVQEDLNYLCAKIHNFIQKCTLYLIYWLKSPHYKRLSRLSWMSDRDKTSHYGDTSHIKPFNCRESQNIFYFLWDVNWGTANENWCWSSVRDGDSTLNHHWINISCLLYPALDFKTFYQCAMSPSIRHTSLIINIAYLRVRGGGRGWDRDLWLGYVWGGGTISVEKLKCADTWVRKSIFPRDGCLIYRHHAPSN